MSPDFSPLMLSLFLRARAAHRQRLDGCARDAAARRTKADLRKLSGRTHGEIDLAWMARLFRPEPRAAIWKALGHLPADHGLMLTHGGQCLAEVGEADRPSRQVSCPAGAPTALEAKS